MRHNKSKSTFAEYEAKKSVIQRMAREMAMIDCLLDSCEEPKIGEFDKKRAMEEQLLDRWNELYQSVRCFCETNPSFFESFWFMYRKYIHDLKNC